MNHGTVGGYTNHRCRCDKCRSAFNAYIAKRKAERIAEGVPPTVEHGKQATYVNWGCRCDLCRTAASARRLENIRAQRARAQ